MWLWCVSHISAGSCLHVSVELRPICSLRVRLPILRFFHLSAWTIMFFWRMMKVTSLFFECLSFPAVYCDCNSLLPLAILFMTQLFIFFWLPLPLPFPSYFLLSLLLDSLLSSNVSTTPAAIHCRNIQRHDVSYFPLDCAEVLPGSRRNGTDRKNLPESYGSPNSSSDCAPLCFLWGQVTFPFGSRTVCKSSVEGWKFGMWNAHNPTILSPLKVEILENDMDIISAPFFLHIHSRWEVVRLGFRPGWRPQMERTWPHRQAST